MSTNLTWRTATVDDTQIVKDLIEASFRADDTRPGWTAHTALNQQFHLTPSELAEMLTSPDRKVLLAYLSPTTPSSATPAAANSAQELPVGTVGIGKRGRITMLAVHPSQHRTGLGRLILAEGEKRCIAEWGVTVLGLNALSSRERLVEWYERRGYVRTGETSRFPVEKFPELDLPEDLCNVEMEKVVK